MAKGMFENYNSYLASAKEQNELKAKIFGENVQDIQPGACFKITMEEAINEGDIQKERYIYIQEIARYGINCVVADQDLSYSKGHLNPTKILFYKKFYNSFVEALYVDKPIAETTLTEMMTLAESLVTKLGLDQPLVNKPELVEEYVYTGNNKEVVSQFVQKAEQLKT